MGDQMILVKTEHKQKCLKNKSFLCLGWHRFDWLKQYTRMFFRRRMKYGQSATWFYQVGQSSNGAELYLYYSIEPPFSLLNNNLTLREEQQYENGKEIFSGAIHW